MTIEKWIEEQLWYVKEDRTLHAFCSQFLKVAKGDFLSDSGINLSYRGIKLEIDILKATMKPAEYLEFWLAFGEIVDTWILELEDLEFYEAASNIKKLYDAC